jgi:DNA-binding beta-propeller fold protein YncE
MKRFLWLCVILFLFLICLGCGDTFRPVIIPNPPKFPDPRASHTVVTISDNGVLPGSAMVINVTGDSDVSEADCQEGSPCIGIAPVHAVQQTATQVLVVNHSVSGALGDSLSKVNFSGTTISGVTTISLPPDSAPTFVAVAPSDTTAYVTLPNYFDPVQNGIVPSVGVVSTTTNSLQTTIPVGNNPSAMAVTPDKSKLYVANQDDNSISAFNTVDDSPRAFDATLFPNPFSSPHWVIVRSDNQRVYVLNGDGSLVTLDTTSTAGTTDTVIAKLLNVGDGGYMLYDGHLNRIYVPSGSQVAIVDVSQDPPKMLGTGGNPLPIDTFPRENRTAQDVCFGAHDPNPPTVTAVAVAALPDGSRFYVGSFYSDGAGNLCPQVTVINTSGNTLKTTVGIPGFPDATILGSPFFVPVCTATGTRFRFTMAAGGDSSRVYLASCDGGNVSFIDTANDTYLQRLPAPVSDRPPVNGNQPPPQNPVFMIAGP